MDPTGQSLLSQVTAQSSGGTLFGFSAWGFAVGIIVSTTGYFYFRYGKQNNDFFTLGTGVVLMAFPYFVTQTPYIIMIAACIIIVHYFSEKQG